MTFTMSEKILLNFHIALESSSTWEHNKCDARNGKCSRGSKATVLLRIRKFC